MTHQLLEQERGRGGIGPAAIGSLVPLQRGAATIRPPPFLSRTNDRGRRLAPAATAGSFRLRVAGWRARNWRRAVLAWFVLSLIIMAVAAEPKTDFPKAQARSVPAVRMFLRVAGA